MEEDLIIATAIEKMCALYSSLSPESRSAFSEKLTIINSRKNTVLVREGQYCDNLFYIVSGSMRMYYIKQGKPITDWFAFENTFICSINSFYEGKPSVYFIETMELTSYLVIKKQDMEILCSRYHDMERLAKHGVIKVMLLLQQRIVNLQFETSLQRYQNLLSLHPDISLRVPLGYIASYLGITLETLSRIRGLKV